MGMLNTKGVVVVTVCIILLCVLMCVIGYHLPGKEVEYVVITRVKTNERVIVEGTNASLTPGTNVLFSVATNFDRETFLAMFEAWLTIEQGVRK